MSEREEFYRQRDLRTKAYIGGIEVGTQPIFIHIDDEAASSRPGQLALLALLNMAARVHRNFTLALDHPGEAVLVPSLFPGADLVQVAKATVANIDPYATFNMQSSVPPGAVTIGIGAKARASMDHYIGCSGAIGVLSRHPTAVDPNEPSIVGAGVAACLGASAIFRTSIGKYTPERRLSAWNYQEGDAAEHGPATFVSLDVGRVLMIGAGAVGSSLAYWCSVLGAAGSWAVLDEDFIALHNTNRSLPFVPAQAGWPVGNAQRKAVVTAHLLPNARPLVAWYDACPELRTLEFDVVLCLANDRGVRELVSARSAPIVLQATTGEDWLSQLHRHIAGVDDCPGCRLGNLKPPRFGCAGTTVANEGEKVDAALPFLSAASSLMLYTALLQLQAGELAGRSRNDWRWDFESPHRMASSGVRHCKPSCSALLPSDVRARINRATRWADLDPLHR